MFASRGQRHRKVFGRHGHEFLRPQWVHRPHQSHFASTFTPKGQQGQHFGLWLHQAGCCAPAKPLAGNAFVRTLAHQAGRHGVLRVVGDVKSHAQFDAGLAGTAFAHHRERRGHRGLDHLNLGLKLDSLGQQRLQCRHVHHPIELAHTLFLGTKIQLTALVTPNLHLMHGCDSGGLGPAAQVLQQGLGCAVERIGAHVGGGVGLG